MMNETETFLSLLRSRLDQGAQDYGEVSFERPESELRGEIEEEILDIAGWAFVLWVRLRRLRAARRDPGEEAR